MRNAKAKQIVFRVDPRTKRVIDERAKAADVSVSAWIRRAITTAIATAIAAKKGQL